MAGQVRKEELLAKAVTIDGRKEWCCRVCSETNSWTKSKCRRCKTGIPFVLQGRHMQTVSTKSARSLSESSSRDGEENVLAYKAQWAKTIA